MAAVSKIQFSGCLKRSIKQAVDEIGGFSEYISQNDKILIKPNFNTADIFPGSTDYDFLKNVIEILIEFNPKEIIIGESCAFRVNTRTILNKLGIFDLEKISPIVKVISFSEHKWIKKKITKGKYLKSVSIPEITQKVDKIIYLPCLKTHFVAKFTGSLKLTVGMIKPIERIPMHVFKIQEKIAEMNTVIKPDLIIMDARKCFISGGPRIGTVREPNLILASASRTAIDVEGIKIIQKYGGNSLKGIFPEKLSQIRYAKELGL